MRTGAMTSSAWLGAATTPPRAKDSRPGRTWKCGGDAGIELGKDFFESVLRAPAPLSFGRVRRVDAVDAGWQLPATPVELLHQARDALAQHRGRVARQSFTVRRRERCCAGDDA